MFWGLAKVFEEEFEPKALDLYKKIDEDKDVFVSQVKFDRAVPKITMFLIANIHIAM